MNILTLKRGSYFAVLSLFFLWMLIGVFPLYCYESDSMHVIAGCEIMYNQGWKLPPLWSYEYDMQPLVTITVVLIKHAIPILTCEQIYCVLTALFTFIFIVGCLFFIKEVYAPQYQYSSILAVFLLPETYAIAMYPNSAIPAATIFVWGFYLLLKRKHFASLILLSIAPLFRIDVLAVYPTVLPLLYIKGYSFKKSFSGSCLYAVGVVGLLAIGLFLLKANPFMSLERYDMWNKRITFNHNLMSILGYYTVAYFILLPVGIFICQKRKLYKTFLMGILPIILVHIEYRSMGCAAKHYLYTAPFLILFGTIAIDAITRYLRNRAIMKVVVGITLTLFLCGSVSVRSIHDVRREHHYGPKANIFEKQKGEKICSVGVGTGQCLATLDEIMLATGNIVYPVYIHRLKEDYLYENTQARQYIDSINSSYNLIANAWDADVSYTLQLFAEGYQFTPGTDGTYLYSLKKQKRFVNVISTDPLSYLATNKQQLIKESATIPTFIITSAAEKETYKQFCKANPWLQHITDILYKISPHRP